tara:strand:+ start:2666 stop:2908 length:243 start_codon:yes stop_codon:yes gene_type:complete
MRRDPTDSINYGAILLKKRFARKRQGNTYFLVLCALLFFSLIMLKRCQANEINQAHLISLDTAAGLVSYSDRLDDGRIYG